MDHQKTVNRVNFLQCLETDISIYIMSFLDDSADLVRVTAVSRLWRQFVIANGLAKQLCLKTFPQLSSVVGIVNASEVTTNSVEVKINSAMELEILERDHKVYASLFQAITKSKVSFKDCIANAVSASSTGNYPDESVVNTLNPRDRFTMRASYWSSKGHINPEVPETLIYKIRAGIWAIIEIDIRPFEAYFQQGKPIYSAETVKFRMGHLKSPTEIGSDLQHLPLQKPADDKFVWTYTSPEFPMMQENRLQAFKLQDPVICIGGYLQVELLGRVQRQGSDGLFYIRLCCVRVVGRPLFPAFDVEILKPNGEILLKYYPDNLNSVLHYSLRNVVPRLRHLENEMIFERVRLLEDLLCEIRGPNYPSVWALWDEDDHHPGFIL